MHELVFTKNNVVGWLVVCIFAIFTLLYFAKIYFSFIKNNLLSKKQLNSIKFFLLKLNNRKIF